MMGEIALIPPALHAPAGVTGGRGVEMRLCSMRPCCSGKLSKPDRAVALPIEPHAYTHVAKTPLPLLPSPSLQMGQVRRQAALETNYIAMSKS